jgi:hypothetical protein
MTLKPSITAGRARGAQLAQASPVDFSRAVAEMVPHHRRCPGAKHLKRRGVDAGVPAGKVAVGSVCFDAAGIASVIATKGRCQGELVTSDRLVVAQ